MSNDESTHQDDEDSRPDGDRDDGSGPSIITTDDPDIEAFVEHPADWRKQAATTVRVETTPATESGPFYPPGV